MNPISNLLLILCFIQTGELVAQSSNDHLRTWSFYSGIGFVEYFVVGGQYQLSEKVSLGGKFTITGVGGPGSDVFPASGKGIGTKISYYFDTTGEHNFLGFNALNVEASFLRHSVLSTTTTLAIEETISHDWTIGSGLKFLFAIGASQAFPTGGFPIHFIAFKLGVHYDI